MSGNAARLGTLFHGKQRLQRRARALRCRLARDVAALRADAVRRQSESDRGDARERRRRPAVGNELRVRIGEVPEKMKAAALDVIEEHSVRGTRDDGALPRYRRSRAGGEQQTKERRSVSHGNSGRTHAPPEEKPRT